MSDSKAPEGDVHELGGIFTHPAYKAAYIASKKADRYKNIRAKYKSFQVKWKNDKKNR